MARFSGDTVSSLRSRNQLIPAAKIGLNELVYFDGTNSAGYAYIANSPLLDHILYTNNGALRMSRTNPYDNLNRLTNLVWKTGSTIVARFAYQYNSVNQRTGITLADGSYWNYSYDSLGQATSGKRYWSDGTPVAGQQFEYGYDSIGNRISTGKGGDNTGLNIRYADYGANSLNQSTYFH